MRSSRSRRFEDWSKTQISHPNTFRYSSVERDSQRARGSGRAIARFFGTSSPNSICTSVDSARASTVPTAIPTATGTPAQPNISANEAPINGSATYPTSRPVTVMPSWAPESMNDVRRGHPQSPTGGGVALGGPRAEA